MSIKSNKKKFTPIEDFLISSSCFGNGDKSGYLLLDKYHNILYSNKFCQSSFKIDTSKSTINSIDLFQRLNKAALCLMNKKIANYNLLLEMNNCLIVKIHEIVKTHNIPVQFVFFIVHKQELKSLLINFIPVFMDGSIHYYKVLISHYDFWAIANLASHMGANQNVPDEYIQIMHKNTNLPIRLTPRQHEIVFFLALNLGLRQTATILNITYGSLSKIVRDSICPKFNIISNNTNELIEQLKMMKYQKFIPQSLCRPIIIILDGQIREKYFSN